MRRLVLLLMILLLPLRGWAGAVMSVEVLGEPSAQVVASEFPSGNELRSVAGIGHGAKALGQNATDKCPGHANPGGTEEAAKEGAGHEKTCFSCQICHSVAMAGDALADAIAPSLFSLIATRSVEFTSATLSGGFKPPIS